MTSQLFCNNCGSVAVPRWVFPGSMIIEGLLIGLGVVLLFASWSVAAFFFLLAGSLLAYKYSKRQYFCGVCGSAEVIPTFAPKAQEFANRAEAFQTIHNRIEASLPPAPQPIAEKTIRPPRKL